MNTPTAPSRRPRTAPPPATLALIAINVAVWLWQVANGTPITDPSPDQLLADGGNLAAYTLTGQGWRLASAMFVHVGLLHLLMNMYVLLFAGWRSEREFGAVRMLAAYLGGGLLASCASTAWNDAHSMGTFLLDRPVQSMVVTAGASGAVMALFGALLAAAMLPRAAVDARGGTGIDKGLLQVVAINIGMGVLVKGVDQAAHVGGLVGGFAIGVLLAAPLPWRGRVVAAARVLGVALLTGACVAWLLAGGDTEERRALREELQASQRAERDERAAADRAARARAERVAGLAAARQRVARVVDEAAARGTVLHFGDSGSTFALSADDRTAYAVDYLGNAIAVIDVAAGRVVRRIAGPPSPPEKLQDGECHEIVCNGPAASDIALAPDGRTALVSSMFPDAVSVVDLAAGSVLATVHVGKAPYEILPSADGRLAYVHLVGEHAIAVVDLAARAVTGRIVLPPSQRFDFGVDFSMWLDDAGRRLHATGFQGGDFRVDTIDLAAGKVVGEGEAAAAFHRAQARGFPADRQFLFDDDALVETTPGREDTIVRRAVCGNRALTAVAALRRDVRDARVALAATVPRDAGQDSRVAIVDLATQLTLGRYPIHDLAMQLRFSSDGARLFVVTNGGDFVVLDPGKSLPPGPEPEGAAAAPALCPAAGADDAAG